MALARIRADLLPGTGKRNVRLSPVIQLLTVEADEALVNSVTSRTGSGLKGATENANVVEKNGNTSQCTSCFDDIKNKKLITLACTHKYCSPCFERLVRTAMANAQYFPPKCCLGEIPAALIRSSLGRRFFSTYQAKAEEYSVPLPDRWYCPYAKCGKWMKLDTASPANKVSIRCPHCRKHVCTTCRAPAHERLQICPQDRDLEATLHTSQMEGWQRCYRCGTLIELVVGCRHMTCTCGAHFCYLCGARWRTCQCTDREHQERQEARRQAAVRPARAQHAPANNARPARTIQPTPEERRRRELAALTLESERRIQAIREEMDERDRRRMELLLELQNCREQIERAQTAAQQEQVSSINVAAT